MATRVTSDPLGRLAAVGPAALRRLFPPPATETPRPLSRFTVVILATVGLLTLGRQVVALFPPEVYRKDMIQEYLLARAILDRSNPYVAQPVLAERYLPAAVALPQSGSHPPFAALISVPLGLLSFEAASALWLGVELLLLLGLAVLLFADGGGRTISWRVAVAFCALLLWYPVFIELFFGQLSLALAVLLVASWQAAKGGRPRLAGVLVGAAIAIKLFPVVIAGYFLLKRRWSVVFWAGATAAALTGLAGMVVGADGFRSYVSEGLPATGYWRAAEGSYSLFSAVWRVFAGSHSIMPLIDLPWLAWPASLLASLGVLAVGALAALRAEDPDAEFSAAICATALAAPITWQHYLVLLIWPLFFIGRRLRAQGWPPCESNALVLAVVGMGVPLGGAFALVYGLTGVALLAGAAPAAGASNVPAVAGLPLLLLPVGPCLLFWLVLRELQRSPAHGPPTNNRRLTEI